jgi:hypothetical protein
MKIRNLFWTIVVAGGLTGPVAFAFGAARGDQRVVCYASGPTLAHRGIGLLEATANFEFVVSENSEGLRTLKDLRGEVVTDPRHLEFDGSWIGKFRSDELVENPNYRPRKYVGYSQFREFDAVDTAGSAESGMWGNFLLEKDMSAEHFQAKYIFQAGDHMGGTLNLGCHRVR